jgi:LPS sulfotransferase NodH
MNRFIILFPGRTGSTFLVEALDEHPLVEAGYEHLSPFRDKPERAAEQIETARRDFERVGSGSIVARGFKTKLRDVHDRYALMELLRGLDVRVILLGRRNLVKLNVSSFNSERLYRSTGDWNAYAQDAVPDDPLVIDPNEFVERLGEYEQEWAEIVDFATMLQQPTLVLYYENLLEDPTGTLQLVFDFIGADPVEAAGRTVKSGGDDLRRMLGNFDELRASVAGTRYEPMFDEGLGR